MPFPARSVTRICQRLGGEARLDPVSESKLVRTLLLSEPNGGVEVHARCSSGCCNFLPTRDYSSVDLDPALTVSRHQTPLDARIA